MDTIRVDLGKTKGPMKPMHAVNNGPVHKMTVDQQESNLHLFREAGIPYARNHDAAFYAGYGGEHTVDISAVFPNFDADPNDPASYDFVLTDEYLQVTMLAGTKIFYRLGSKIEHWKKKYGTLPPKDFRKWAVVCEHIVRHFNEGWADGFHMGIEYWEIWNEPDLDPDDSPNKRTWGGTAKEFYELFDITVGHLKKCFPGLKIGGPAVCSINEKWLEGLFDRLTAPIDFFSWHIYAREPEAVRREIRHARAVLDRHGLTQTESILNEWNYVTSFDGAEEWLYSRKMEKGIKGAAFAASVMCDSLYEPLDMLMYYDARPCGMCGLFDSDFPSQPLKGYYPFKMFNRLYALGEAVEAESGCEKLHACAARGKKGFAAMVSHFDDDDRAAGRTAWVQFQNAPEGTKRISLYLLDKEHDMARMREEIVEGREFGLRMDAPLFGTWLMEAEIL